jgi:methanogenic corrinoid protein MtbC1
MYDSLYQAVFQAIKASDRIKANNLIDDFANTSSYRDAINEIIEPIMYTLGEQWIKEETTLAQTYVAAKIAEDTLQKAIHSHEYEKTATEVQRCAVVGNIREDFHSLGRRMVGTFLRASGWRVVDLGNDVAPQKFIDAVLEHNCRVIGVSAMMYSTAMNIAELRNLIVQKNLEHQLKVAVGGAVFKLTPTLVNEVGGDGSAKNAIDAPKLFNSLFEAE